jgi:predicted HAD superfamily hydrolase
MEKLNKSLISHEFVTMLILINNLKRTLMKEVTPIFSKSTHNHFEIENTLFSINNSLSLLDESVKTTLEYFEEYQFC